MGWTRSPVRQGECATLNVRIHEKYDDQETPLLGESVLGPAFLRRERTRRSFFFKESRTGVSGYHGRTGAVLNLGPTLAGSSDEHLDLISTRSVSSLH